MEASDRRKVLAMLAIAAAVALLWFRGPRVVLPGGKADDWAYSPPAFGADGAPGALGGGVMYSMSKSAAAESIGLSAGGAKDVDNLRENIAQGFLPVPTDVTYEGLFYDYYFDTGEAEPCAALFCPSYSHARSRDPISGAVEDYLAVGLNSNIKESDFQRKRLDLVVVLDISGSMGSPFDRYYYDGAGRRVDTGEGEGASKTKLQLATASVAALIDHLGEGDRFGMALFDDEAYLAKPLAPVEATDMALIKSHVLELQPRGGTQFSAGMKLGTELYDALEPPEPSERERRIIFLTDAMPNIGETSEGGLLGMARANAARGIHATFIGIGVDFNTELVEAITKVRGANYHSVHSAKEFKERMDEGFDYMVTPLVFDLRLRLESPGWSIEKVFGSPEADEATGELMHVNTLFPSKREGGETRGGLVLLKLRRTAPEGGAIRLVAAYEDRAGAAGSSEAAVTVPAEGPEGADNAGVRKGVLLARYASLLKDWLRDERAAPGPAPPVYTVTRETGIVVPREGPEEGLGRWERRSEPLRVSAHYRELFGAFRDHLKAEMDAIGDATLARELEVLDKLRTPGGGG